MKTCTKIAIGAGALVGSVALARWAFTSGPWASKAPEPPILAPGDRVALVGDSIGVGLSGPLGSALKHLTSVVKSGATVKDVLAFVKANPNVLTGAKAVVVSVGSNDAALADPNVEVQAVDDLMALLTANGARVVWASPPNFSLPEAQVPAPATALKQEKFDAIFTTGFNVDRVDLDHDTIASELASDRVHLTPKGYQAFAKQIANHLTGGASA